MALRINHNISALRSLRTLTETDKKLAESLERLSSGFRINRGGDSPSGLVISEQMRGQIAGINQSVANTELATAMVQTAEGGLTTVNNLLIRMRQLALHASNEGGNDPQSVEADQIEIDSTLETISRIAATAQFGTRNLLDGSSSVTGEALGEGLKLLNASEETRTSPVRGYTVNLEQAPSKAMLGGEAPITPENVSGLTISLFENGKSVQVTGNTSDSVDSFYGRLVKETEASGLNLELNLSQEKLLSVSHAEYGSDFSFEGASSQPGVLSTEADVPVSAASGADIRGTIGGESTTGKGTVLTSLLGNDNTEGISIRYDGRLEEVAGENPEDPTTLVRVLSTGIVGTANIANNAPIFQVGPNVGQRINVALPETSAQSLGRDVENGSEFHSLRDINVTTAQGSQDSLLLIDKAINEVTKARGKLGAFQKNTLESNLSTLRVAAENLTAAESTIRDADIAQELSEFTKNRILFESGTAMLAQANQLPATVIDLIK